MKNATSSVFKLEPQFLTYKLNVLLIFSSESQMEEDNVQKNYLMYNYLYHGNDSTILILFP